MNSIIKEIINKYISYTNVSHGFCRQISAWSSDRKLRGG